MLTGETSKSFLVPFALSCTIVRFTKNVTVIQLTAKSDAVNCAATVPLISLSEIVINFINHLIIYIPDYHFLTTRYYGFYANASKKTLDKVHALLKNLKNKDYSRETRKKLKNRLNKLKYRTHLIDSLN